MFKFLILHIWISNRIIQYLGANKKLDKITINW